MATDNIARGLSKRNEKVLEKEAQVIIDKAVDVKLNTIETDKVVNSLNQSEDGFVNIERIKGKTLQNFSNNRQRRVWNTPTNRYYPIDGFLGLHANRPHTIILNIENIKIIPPTGNLGFGTDIYYSDGTTESTTFSNRADSAGLFKEVITFKKHVSRFNLKGLAGNYQEDGLGNSVTLSDLMILEGDWTNKEIPPYFEGIKSVGEDEGSISLYTASRNQFNYDKYFTGLMLNKQNNELAYNIIKVKPRTKYTVSTNVPLTNGYASLFASNTNESPNTQYNGVASEKALTVTTNNAGELYITVRATSGAPMINLTRDMFASGEFWVMIEESDVKNDYYPYEIQQFSWEVSEPLRSLPNGVCDEIIGDKLIRRVGKVVLNGGNKETWSTDNSGKVNIMNVALVGFLDGVRKNNDTNIISDYLVSDRTFSQDVEGIFKTSSGFYLGISKSKLATNDLAGFRSYLSKNPITVYFELETPITTTISLPSLKSFKNGLIYLQNSITPNVTIKYPTNLAGRVFMAEQEYSRANTSVNNYWQTLLILADRELRMKSIQPLTTNTTADIKNKLNEIMNAWK